MKSKAIGVIGAGTMGNGIAQVCAVAGYDVFLLDISQAAVDRGLSTLRKNLDRQVAKQALTQQIADDAYARIQPSTDYEILSQVAMAIEAATESLELKVRVLNQIATYIDCECVIATNTSSLSVTQLAAAIDHPERFIGLHFFNPVPMMRLEVIRGLRTSDACHERVMEVGREA